MILSPTELRAFISTELADPALMTLLDATEQIIDTAIGPTGAVTEWIGSGSGDLFMLSRPASAITSVIEGDDTLASDDYELASSGRTVRRLDDGTNPDSRWRGRIRVTYTAADDLAQRKIAQVGLCRIALDTNVEAGATQSERIGDWSETFTSSQEARERKDEVLATLTRNRLVIL